MKKKATTPAPENGPAEREDSIPVQVSQPRYGVLDIGRPVTEQVAELANASAAPEPAWVHAPPSPEASLDAAARPLVDRLGALVSRIDEPGYSLNDPESVVLTVLVEARDLMALAQDALLQHQAAAPVVIRLDIYGGVVDGPIGLPPGVQLHVHDIDRNHYKATDPCDVHPEGGCVVHEFTGE